MKTSRERAVEALEFNQNFQEIHVTADGVPFLNKNDAKNHATKLDNPTVDSFTREELFGAVEEEFELPKKAEDLIAFVNIQEDVEALKAIKEAGEKRKTVVTAIDARIAELEAFDSSEEDKESDDEGDAGADGEQSGDKTDETVNS